MMIYLCENPHVTRIFPDTSRSDSVAVWACIRCSTRIVLVSRIVTSPDNDPQHIDLAIFLMTTMLDVSGTVDVIEPRAMLTTSISSCCPATKSSLLLVSVLVVIQCKSVVCSLLLSPHSFSHSLYYFLIPIYLILKRTRPRRSRIWILLGLILIIPRSVSRICRICSLLCALKDV